MYNNKLKAIVLPVVIALAIVLGMGINSLLDHKEVPVNMGQRMIGSKLDYILNMINYSYVDSVDIHKIEEDAIPQILNDLDPHTVYIPAKDMQRVNEEMVGNFGGVGVQFYKYLDTVTVVKVVPGGPSEAAGLQDGDRIVKVNDSIVAGRNMNTDKIMSLMRGEIGTDVQLTIVRRGEKQPLIKNTGGAQIAEALADEGHIQCVGVLVVQRTVGQAGVILSALEEVIQTDDMGRGAGGFQSLGHLMSRSRLAAGRRAGEHDDLGAGVPDLLGSIGHPLAVALLAHLRQRRRALGGDVVQVYLNQTFRYPNRDHKKQPLLFSVPALRRNAGCILSDT